MTDSEEHKRPKVGIGVFVFRDGKFLLGKRKNAHGDGTWGLPGGHLEFGESWEECARREVREEVGVEITNVRSLTATNDVYEKEGKHYITLFMRSDYLSGNPRNLEPHKLERWEWVAWDNLPSPLFLPIETLLMKGFDPTPRQSES
jgi:8-oxo-dGTP diphosphatase